MQFRYRCPCYNYKYYHSIKRAGRFLGVAYIIILCSAHQRNKLFGNSERAQAARTIHKRPSRRCPVLYRNLTGIDVVNPSLRPSGHRLRYVLDSRLQPTAMIYLVGLLSGAQVEYKPVDLKSYEARNGASLA